MKAYQEKHWEIRLREEKKKANEQWNNGRRGHASNGGQRTKETKEYDKEEKTELLMKTEASGVQAA